MQGIQEAAHAQRHDYREGSPHLKHHQLHDRLLELLRAVLRDASSRRLPRTLLEVGAGHGAFVEPVLAAGFRVTATELSRPSMDLLTDRYGENPQFSGVFDADGRLRELGDQRFSIVLYASVLHHIPDYVRAIEDAVDARLNPGGTLVTVQDPMWYPAVSRTTRLMSLAAYFSWRVTQGNYGRGVRTRLRRLRGEYDPTNVSDTAEYHADRQGVDQREIARTLSPRFDAVDLITYWSTQAGIWQRAGEAIGMRNTFAIVARGKKAAE